MVQLTGAHSERATVQLMSAGSVFCPLTSLGRCAWTLALWEPENRIFKKEKSKTRNHKMMTGVTPEVVKGEETEH